MAITGPVAQAEPFMAGQAALPITTPDADSPPVGSVNGAYGTDKVPMKVEKAAAVLQQAPWSRAAPPCC